MAGAIFKVGGLDKSLNQIIQDIYRLTLSLLPSTGSKIKTRAQRVPAEKTSRFRLNVVNIGSMLSVP